jgi:hypothetical protein
MTPDKPPVPVQVSELRASDADRDRTVEILSASAGEGRLSLEELNDRVEVALSARTAGQLAMLIADLPGAHLVADARDALDARDARDARGDLSETKKAKDLVRIDLRFGREIRTGCWVVPRSMEIRLTGGVVRLDFSQAIVTADTLRINVAGRSGSLVLVTRPGISIDVDDLEVRHGNLKVKRTYGRSRQRDLRVEISGQLNFGSFTARPSRQTPSGWLLRRMIPRPIRRRGA